MLIIVEQPTLGASSQLQQGRIGNSSIQFSFGGTRIFFFFFLFFPFFFFSHVAEVVLQMWAVA